MPRQYIENGFPHCYLLAFIFTEGLKYIGYTQTSADLHIGLAFFLLGGVPISYIKLSSRLKYMLIEMTEAGILCLYSAAAQHYPHIDIRSFIITLGIALSWSSGVLSGDNPSLLSTVVVTRLIENGIYFLAIGTHGNTVKSVIILSIIAGINRSVMKLLDNVLFYLEKGLRYCIERLYPAS